jgi:hypothetical protein
MRMSVGTSGRRSSRDLAKLMTLAAVALVTVSALESGAVVVAASADAAGCAPVIDKVAVSDVVIYASSASRAVTTVTTHDPCADSIYTTPGIFDVSGTAYLSDGDSWSLSFNNSTTSAWTGATGAYFDKYSAVGRGSVSVEVMDSDINTTYRDGIPFFVRRNVTMASFNASPEPVRRGAAITVSGTVSRLAVGTFGVTKYVPYAAHNVDIYFRPLTSSKYTKVSSATTTASGSFARGLTATVDGCWRAYSVQTSYNVGRWSPSDCVDVQ